MSPSSSGSDPRPRAGLSASFGYAVDGVLRTLVGERNMKIHWVSGCAVVLVGMALPLPASARAALLFAVALVLATEVLNAAVEGLVDLAAATWVYSAKRAKDAAAGVVLTVSVAAVVILADVLVHHWGAVEASRTSVMRTILYGVPSLAALGTLLVAPRRLPWLAGACAVGLATYAPLAFASADIVFTLVGLALWGGAVGARVREPSLLDQRPPDA